MKITYFHNKLDKRYRKESTEAVEWVLKLKSGELPPEDQAQFDAWLCESSKNAEKFKLINALWESTETLREDAFTSQVMNRRGVTEKEQPAREKPIQSLTKQTRFRWAASAAALLVIIVSAVLTQSYLGTEKMYRTDTGEQRSIYFDDGSFIHLDSETHIAAAFDEKIRHIDLEKGRALFSVAHDPNRPFVVTVGTINVRALGTKFNVDKLDDMRVAVAVTEGKVKVTKAKDDEVLGKKIPFATIEAPQPKPGKSIAQYNEKMENLRAEIISTGEAIVVDDREKKYQVKQVNLKQANAWREGRLHFSKAHLPDVIGEINRYLKKKIVIGDERLNDVEINMNFDIKHCKYFLDTLHDVVPVTKHTDSHNRIVIAKRD
ncbi:MAG: FecR domain-containing protein [Deltaproteobacteria bacterium]|nr:FecR domain-containing protein [Deltaproteobacteria bacterium]